MTQLQVLQNELKDKMEYFDWLIKDIEDTVRQIEQLKLGETNEI